MCCLWGKNLFRYICITIRVHVLIKAGGLGCTGWGGGFKSTKGQYPPCNVWIFLCAGRRFFLLISLLSEALRMQIYVYVQQLLFQIKFLWIELNLIFCSKDSTWAQLEPSKTGSANFFVFTKICVSVESTTTRTNVFANIIANSRTSRNRFCLFIWGPGGVFNQTVWKSHNTGSLINKRITRKLIKTF